MRGKCKRRRAPKKFKVYDSSQVRLFVFGVEVCNFSSVEVMLRPDLFV